MAMARPVVTTPGALEGINAERGRDLLTGATADEFAACVNTVLAGDAPKDLGAQARAFVLAKHQWSTNLATLDALIVSLGCG
jgi:hypothetical protein